MQLFFLQLSQCTAVFLSVLHWLCDTYNCIILWNVSSFVAIGTEYFFFIFIFLKFYTCAEFQMFEIRKLYLIFLVKTHQKTIKVYHFLTLVLHFLSIFPNIFSEGRCCNPLWIIKMERQVTLNLLAVYSLVFFLV